MANTDRMTANIDYPMSKAMSSLTLNVRFTGQKVARARLWLGARLLMLGALVIGCGIEIDSHGSR